MAVQGDGAEALRALRLLLLSDNGDSGKWRVIGLLKNGKGRDVPRAERGIPALRGGQSDDLAANTVSYQWNLLASRLNGTTEIAPKCSVIWRMSINTRSP
jgi:hypothetical protein